MRGSDDGFRQIRPSIFLARRAALAALRQQNFAHCFNAITKELRIAILKVDQSPVGCVLELSVMCRRFFSN